MKRQERRMELAKGQPRMVTLQKRHKGHVRAKKKNHKKRKEGKKKKEKYRNTQTALTEISSLLLREMSSCTARAEKPGCPREEGSLPGQTHTGLLLLPALMQHQGFRVCFWFNV